MGPEVLVPTLVTAPIGAPAVAMLPATGAAAGGFSIGSVLTGVGSVFSALSNIRAGQAAQGQAEVQAELFRREAQRRKEIAEQDASEFARNQRKLLARQRLLFGATGTEIGTGTPLSIREDTAGEAEFQRLKILAGGAADESRLLSQASLTQFEGRQQRRLGTLKAGGALLRGASILTKDEVFG